MSARAGGTRSRSNPGGMDVLTVLGPDVRPLRERKPPWFKVPPPGGQRYRELTQLIREENLHTVCQEAACPNVGECWERGTATFMILGDTCTRRCGFCNVKTGKPTWHDPLEPAREKVALAIPGAHLALAVLGRLGFERVPPQRLVPGDVQVVGEAPARVVLDERGEHPAVMISGQDPLHDHVEPMVESEPGGEVDQADVRSARHIVLPQHLAAKVVLTDNRQAPPVPAANLSRDGRLPRRRVAANHDQRDGTLPAELTQRSSSFPYERWSGGGARGPVLIGP